MSYILVKASGSVFARVKPSNLAEFRMGKFAGLWAGAGKRIMRLERTWSVAALAPDTCRLGPIYICPGYSFSSLAFVHAF